MTKKFQVFISSTYQDLVEEREQVIRAVLEMGHIPVGMEMFSAADEEQWRLIARTIDDIDYYAIIVAHRYGSTTPDGLSYTEKEFDYAVAKGIPVLGFVIDDKAPWPKDRCDSDSKAQRKLIEFKRKVKGRLVQFWTTRDDLHGKFSISLMKAITTNPRVGWVRSTETAGVEVTRELTRLSSENSVLRNELSTLRSQAIEHRDSVRETIKVLTANKRHFNVRTSADWDKARKHTRTLAAIFQYTAPNLILEASSLGVAQAIALNTMGTKFHASWPLGKNIIAELIADLAALELVEPSKRKHSLKDSNEYWCLTRMGKQVHKEFRRVLLQEGLEPPPTVAEAPGSDG